MLGNVARNAVSYSMSICYVSNLTWGKLNQPSAVCLPFEQEAHQLVGRQNAAALDFDPKPSEAAFFGSFFAVASDRKELVTSYPVKM